MRKGTKMTKKSRKLISLGITGAKNPMFGKHHSKKTIKLLKEKALKQFEHGMPNTTKQKMIKASKKRVFLSIGNTFINSGYVWVKVGKRKYISQHRYNVEKYIGRRLKKNELVHHINGNGLNNKLSNLYIFTKKEVHFSFEILFKNGYLKPSFLKSNLKEFKLTGRPVSNLNAKGELESQKLGQFLPALNQGGYND